MPRKKKKWIDKKKAVTYQLVNRGQRDPLIGDEGSSKNVLTPILMYGNAPVVIQPEKDDVIFGDLGGYDYNQHTKAMGQPGAVFISPSGEIMDPNPQKLPVEVLPSILEKGLMERELRDDELDDEILETFENFDELNVEELADDFVVAAQKEDVESADINVNFGSYGKYDELDDVGGSFGSYGKYDELDDVGGPYGKYDKLDDLGGDPHDDEEDDDFDDEIKSTTSSAQNQRKRTIVDEQFDIAYEAFEADESKSDDEESYDSEDDEHGNQKLDDPILKGALSTSDFKEVFDEFLESASHRYTLPSRDSDDDKKINVKQSKKERIGQKTTNTQQQDNEKIPYEPTKTDDLGSVPTEAEEEYEEEEEDNFEDLELLYVRQKNIEWDAESIISTYSNTDNHPALIAEPNQEKLIKINKKGFPDVFKSDKPERQKKPEQEPPVTAPPVRSKNETAEEKKLRKKAVKEERRVNRERKKELKVQFREEIVNQRKIGVGQITRRTVIQY